MYNKTNKTKKLQEIGVLTQDGKLSESFNNSLFTKYYEGENVNLKGYTDEEVLIFKRTIDAFDRGIYCLHKPKQNTIIKIIISTLSIDYLKELIIKGRI